MFSHLASRSRGVPDELYDFFLSQLCCCEGAPAVGTERHHGEGRGSHTGAGSMVSPGAAGKLNLRSMMDTCVVVSILPCILSFLARR